MRRSTAVLVHGAVFIIAAALYFFFVLPRWWELMGETPHTLGTVVRIVAGVLIGLAALPVVAVFVRTRRPEFGTPRLALGLRVTSIALQVLAGVLIVGAAISEIWLSLDAAGQWLFGVYGAAASLALLGLLAFHLAYVAEKPPPPPKPLKTREKKQRRGRRKADDTSPEDTAPAEADEPEATEADEPEAAEATEATEGTDTEVAEQAEADDQPAEVVSEATEITESSAEEESDEPESEGGLRNRRPAGKLGSARRRKRSRGGVALDD
jgi:hypothetical protein